jgi:hypothetical protein
VTLARFSEVFLTLRVWHGGYCSDNFLRVQLVQLEYVWVYGACKSARASCSRTWRESLGDSSLRSPSAQVAIPPGHQLPLWCVHMVGELLTAATWEGSHPS